MPSLRYRLYNEDCFTVFDKLADNSVDMVMVDPPYGTTACKWDSIIPLEPMWEGLKRVTKENGAIVFMASEPFTSVLITSNIKVFKYCWQWNKMRGGNHLNSRKQPLRTMETVCVFYRKQVIYNPILRDRDKKHIRDPGTAHGKSGNKVYGQTKENYLFNSGREIPLDKGYPLDILEFGVTGNFGSKRVHPTQKPVALMEYLIRTYTNEGETVLDFAMGSGTTGVACGNLNRRFIGCDNDVEHGYYAIAKERIREAYRSKKAAPSI